MPKMSDIECIADLEESERLLNACIDALTTARQDESLIMVRLQTRPDRFSGFETAFVINNVDPAVIEDAATLRQKIFNKAIEEPGPDFTGSIVTRFERVGNLKDCLRTFSCTIKDDTAEQLQRGTNPSLLDNEAKRWIATYEAMAGIMGSGATMMHEMQLVVQHVTAAYIAGQTESSSDTFQGEAINLLKQIGAAAMEGDIGVNDDPPEEEPPQEQEPQQESTAGQQQTGEPKQTEAPEMTMDDAEAWAREHPEEAKAMAKKLLKEGVIKFP